jgi:hypothetical protein
MPIIPRKGNENYFQPSFIKVRFIAYFWLYYGARGAQVHKGDAQLH